MNWDSCSFEQNHLYSWIYQSQGSAAEPWIKFEHWKTKKQKKQRNQKTYKKTFVWSSVSVPVNQILQRRKNLYNWKLMCDLVYQCQCSIELKQLLTSRTSLVLIFLVQLKLPGKTELKYWFTVMLDQIWVTKMWRIPYHHDNLIKLPACIFL